MNGIKDIVKNSNRMKVLIAGDFCSYGRVERLIEQGNYSRIFGNVKPYVSSVEVSIVNLESPVVSCEARPIEKHGSNLSCSDKAVEALSWAGFNVVTLANNHFLDYGRGGVQDTLNACRRNGIESVGGGLNLLDAQKVFYKKIGNEMLAVVNCCEHEFSVATATTAGANPLNPIWQYYQIREARGNADYVLVIVHGGHEYYQLPSPRMVETYRFFVDAGADCVINHHQHCYSGYELYKGKPIFYGLGNFSFDWNGIKNRIWNEGFMLQMELKSVEDGIVFKMIPYEQGDEEAGIKLMDGEKSRLFYEKIRELQKIIINDDLLRESFEDFVKKKKKRLLASFYPLSNRYAKALYYRNLLPSFWTKKKVLEIRNVVECEAHRDVLLRALVDERC